jgi:CHAD domain-containing protein
MRKKLPDQDDLSARRLREYLQEEFAAIAAPKGSVPAEQWHDVRKHVKRLYYHLEMAEPLLDPVGPSRRMMDFTDKAGSQLGTWHDLVAFRQFVNDSTKLMKNIGVTVPKGATTLCRRITIDIRKELQECRLLLQQKPDLSLL